VAAGFGTIGCCAGKGGCFAGKGRLLLGRRRRGIAGEGWRRWCWKESQLIGASGGGGRLRWGTEEPERTSSGGACGAAAAGTCAARGPGPAVRAGPAVTAARAGTVTSGLPCGHSVGANCDFAGSGHADACSSTEARRVGPDPRHWLRPDARACCVMTRLILSVAHVRAERKGALQPSAWQGGSADAGAYTRPPLASADRVDAALSTH
jgi:hypothetical protein